MAEPFLGEIRLFGGNFAPSGWALCDGQLLSTTQNELLFELIGTTYGGEGVQNFALPDLSGRVPVHQGIIFRIGQRGGVETVALTQAQIPHHSHPARGQTGAGTQGSPAGAAWAASSLNQYSASAANASMASGLLQPAGGGQAHDNMMPFLTVSFIIALEGIPPTLQKKT